MRIRFLFFFKYIFHVCARVCAPHVWCAIAAAAMPTMCARALCMPHVVVVVGAANTYEYVPRAANTCEYVGSMCAGVAGRGACPYGTYSHVFSHVFHVFGVTYFAILIHVFPGCLRPTARVGGGCSETRTILC